MGQGYLNYVRPFLPTLFILIGWFFHPFGKWGDILSLILSLVTLMGATIYTYKVGESRAKENEALRMKQFLSHQRHDWMNDVQIILGYVSLKKMDRMKSYLEQQVQKANDERLITQLQYAPLAVSLITLPQRFLQWRMKIRVGDIADYTIEEEKQLLSIMDLVFPWLEKQLQDVIVDVQMNIHIAKKEKATLVIAIGNFDEGTIIHMNDLHQIRNTIRKWHGDFTFNIERNEIEIKI